MAARQVTRAPRGFTLIELMAAVAICAILLALAANSLTTARKIARVSGQTRLLLQRLQSVRTAAVSQGAAQGYYIGQNGVAAAGPDAYQAYIFYKLDPTSTPVVYASGVDRPDTTRDFLPRSTNQSLVTVAGTRSGSLLIQPAPLGIGFDMNGQVTVDPPPGGWPYCLVVTDATDPVIVRYVILFNDGSAKVQKDETWCP
jgi:prepilin-type N-terminal cleavage/methylation domain-containing protein